MVARRRRRARFDARISAGRNFSPLIERGLAITACIGAAIIATACASENSRTTPADDSTVAIARGRQEIPGRQARSYVGLEYTSPPAGVTFLSGAVLSSPGDTRGNYAFAQVTDPQGEMIWLDTIAANIRVVRAQLLLPDLARDERLFISTCDVGGRLSPRVIAIAVDEPNVTRFAKVRQAWLANLQAGRFEIIPVAGVVCENPESGPT